ncbi:O64 family O-antigen polymerase, partial [Escherichia coli]
YMLYNRLHTKTTLFVFFLCLLLLVLTGSKTVLFLSLLFLCVTFTKISLLRQKSTFVILVSFSVLFLLIATIFGDYFYEIISSRFLSGNALDSSGRYEIYLGIFDKLNQNIIFGTGLDLREDYSQYFPGWLRLSDSVYGNILVSSGMFGFLIFTLTMFCFLATVIKKDRVRFLFLLVLSIGFLFEDYLLRGFSFMFIMSVTFYLISTNFKFGNTK